MLSKLVMRFLPRHTSFVANRLKHAIRTSIYASAQAMLGPTLLPIPQQCRKNEKKKAQRHKGASGSVLSSHHVYMPGVLLRPPGMAPMMRPPESPPVSLGATHKISSQEPGAKAPAKRSTLLSQGIKPKRGGDKAPLASPVAPWKVNRAKAAILAGSSSHTVHFSNHSEEEKEENRQMCSWAHKATMTKADRKAIDARNPERFGKSTQADRQSNSGVSTWSRSGDHSRTATTTKADGKAIDAQPCSRTEAKQCRLDQDEEPSCDDSWGQWTGKKPECRAQDMTVAPSTTSVVVDTTSEAMQTCAGALVLATLMVCVI